MTESYHEPNLGFKSILSKWEESSANKTTSPVVAKRKTREEAKLEFIERKKSLATDESKKGATTTGSIKKKITRAHFR